MKEKYSNRLAKKCFSSTKKRIDDPLKLRLKSVTGSKMFCLILQIENLNQFRPKGPRSTDTVSIFPFFNSRLTLVH